MARLWLSRMLRASTTASTWRTLRWKSSAPCRYNPELAEQGKNPLIVDSKDPTENYQDFIRGEVRYASLAKLFPAKAEEAYKINEEDAKRRLETYKKLAAE